MFSAKSFVREHEQSTTTNFFQNINENVVNKLFKCKPPQLPFKAGRRSPIRKLKCNPTNA